MPNTANEIIMPTYGFMREPLLSLSSFAGSFSFRASFICNKKAPVQPVVASNANVATKITKQFERQIVA